MYRKQWVNPMAFTAGFHPEMIKYCLMHVLHLGVAHLCNGGALMVLMEHEFFGPSSSLQALVLLKYGPTFCERFAQYHPRICFFPSQATLTFAIPRPKEHGSKWATGGAYRQIQAVDCGQ